MRKDDEAAFPFNNSYLSREGMSLRDYFAIKLAAALLNYDALVNPSGAHRYQSEDGFEFLAMQAYIGADAMLAEREKEAK